jgi:hypothetical protein
MNEERPPPKLPTEWKRDRPILFKNRGLSRTDRVILRQLWIRVGNKRGCSINQTCPLANRDLPPLTAIDLPSTYAPALLARNSTTPAMSSKAPALFAGTFDTKSPKISAPDLVPMGFILLGTTGLCKKQDKLQTTPENKTTQNIGLRRG